MLTPAFELNQDHCFLYIEIKAPFTKISETEIFAEENDFKFYSKPYYLRLSLPRAIVEDGREEAKYDADSGTYNIKFPKAKPGEVFEGLDLVTKLLAPSGSKSAKQPLIEVLDTAADVPEAEAANSADDEEDFDWQIEQEPYKEELDVVKLTEPKYGFACQRSGVLRRLQSEIPDLIDLPDADTTPACERRDLRLAHEREHFDEDYYLSDLYQNPAIDGYLDYRPPWVEEYRELRNDREEEDIVTFTEEEKYKMRKLPRKEYLLDTATTRKVLLGLVDIIFAYCYNHRSTEGENTVESGWTIAKLSATLSWLDSYTSIRDCLVTCYRRCLCYPLYRHWRLTHQVHRDTLKIFSLGRRRLLKCLLEVHDLFQQSDSRYILNDLYITDYCVWLQSVSSKRLDSLVHELLKVKISKKQLFLDLELLEQAAEMAISEDKEASAISVANLHINPEQSVHLQNDREAQLAEQIKQLSIQKGSSTNDNTLTNGGPSAVDISDSEPSESEEADSSSSDESSSEETDDSEYLTASEDTNSDDEKDVVDSSPTEAISEVEKTMKEVFEGSEKLPKKCLIAEVEQTVGKHEEEDNDKLCQDSRSDSCSLNF